MSTSHNLDGAFTVQSDKCQYNEDYILSNYTYVRYYVVEDDVVAWQNNEKDTV